MSRLSRAVVADLLVQAALSDVVQLVKPFDRLQDTDFERRIEAHAQMGSEGRALPPSQ